MSQTAAYLDIMAPRWGKEESDVQIVPSRKPYVYGTNRNNALIHVVRHLRLRWWTYGADGHCLVRLQSPRMTAVTRCGRYISLNGVRGKTCALPRPDAVLCKACLGKGRNFPRGETHEVPVELARVRLGCVEVPA